MHKNKLLTICCLFCFLFSPLSYSLNPDSDIIDMSGPMIEKVGELEFRECQISAQGRNRKVQCARFNVPENPDNSNGDRIDIFIVRLPAKRSSKEALDPVLFISGGPGQASTATFLFADQTWSALNKKRDFYLIDQRGTGHSNNMGCKEAFEEFDSLSSRYDSKLAAELTRKCLQVLPGDPRFYTTEISLKDFEAIRSALKVEKWNLLGVSYGTRVSTQYVRLYPESLRSVVLDSVLPPQHITGSEIAYRSQKMLDVLFQRCQSSPECKKHHPALKENVNSLLERLEGKPVQVKYENIRTGTIEEVEFSRELLMITIRMYLYSPYTVSVLPVMLNEAATKGNYSPLVRASLGTSESLDSVLSIGLHNAVMCTEEYPYYQQISEQTRSENKGSYMGEQLFKLMHDICSIWPVNATDPANKSPLKSDIPALILSGQYDPITPPEYGDQALTSFSNGKHFVLKGQGHFVSASGCAPNLINEFVNQQSVANLNSSCLQRLGDLPLFLNFNGSAP